MSNALGRLRWCLTAISISVTIQYGSADSSIRRDYPCRIGTMVHRVRQTRHCYCSLGNLDTVSTGEILARHKLTRFSRIYMLSVFPRTRRIYSYSPKKYKRLWLQASSLTPTCSGSAIIRIKEEKVSSTSIHMTSLISSLPKSSRLGVWYTLCQPRLSISKRSPCP